MHCTYCSGLVFNRAFSVAIMCAGLSAMGATTMRLDMCIALFDMFSSRMWKDLFRDTISSSLVTCAVVKTVRSFVGSDTTIAEPLLVTNTGVCVKGANAAVFETTTSWYISSTTNAKGADSQCEPQRLQYFESSWRVRLRRLVVRATVRAYALRGRSFVCTYRSTTILTIHQPLGFRQI